jgi:UDP-4-amino-4,6-dideoxy-N-acetyl-beta-L-altrosamine transaminase
VQAVLKVLGSDWITQGPEVERFEKSIAEACGAKYAVSVNSGTSALHLACLAHGLRSGGILWTSPNTFVASANCGLYCGAEVNFVDIDPRTYNMSTIRLKEKLAEAERTGKLPKIVIPVHFAGQSCELAEIEELSRSYGFTVIEDAAHALGGRYRGTPIGACNLSDMTVFSFHPVKNITTGEGGMIVTNRRDIYERLVLFRSHGITRDPDSMRGEPHGPWYYQQIGLGFNYRMTDIQAALGTSQLSRLTEFVERRHSLVGRYNAAFRDLPVVLPWQHPDTHSAYHLYVLRLKLIEIRKTRRQIFEELRAAGIGVNVHYIPVHTQPHYQHLGFRPGNFPEAEKYYEEAITLPLFSGLTDEDQDYVIDVFRRTLE